MYSAAAWDEGQASRGFHGNPTNSSQTKNAWRMIPQTLLAKKARSRRIYFRRLRNIKVPRPAKERSMVLGSGICEKVWSMIEISAMF